MTVKQKKTSIIFGQIKNFFVNLQKYQKTILINTNLTKFKYVCLFE